VIDIKDGVLKEFGLRLRWAVFISGRGSNLLALTDLRNKIDIGLVLSCNPKAYGLLRAKRAGIPVWHSGDQLDWLEVEKILQEYSIQRIFLAGFMKILPKSFVKNWKHRILNIHPSLLPHYKGLNSIERSHHVGPWGVTVHEVVSEVDRGPILKQRNFGFDVDFIRSMSSNHFESYVHINEHRLVRESVEKWKSVPTLLS